MKDSPPEREDDHGPESPGTSSSENLPFSMLAESFNPSQPRMRELTFVGCTLEAMAGNDWEKNGGTGGGELNDND